MNQLRVAVAVPARNEAERIEACLASLARQRDSCGAPLPASLLTVLVYANDCTDGTADTVRAWAGRTAFPVRLVVEAGSSREAHAGRARKRAMDLAADILEREGAPDSFVLTTDADTCVSPTWLDATLAAFAEGADAVAGYVDVHPLEMMALAPTFLTRSRLEDRYLRLVSEIYAICDPRPHDPWPNHRFSSGASLAVRLAAYRAVGGLPAEPVGEDAAFTRNLEAAGFRVRHSLLVQVSTSPRFDGRAAGGTADTMRHRHETSDATCGDDLEPALLVTRRALLQGRARRGDAHRADAPRRPLRPADLPRQIARAESILRRLRSAV
jgi:cellulose synthase/poly-beta-1,6-N-acetylglucosamine synthase-like glycosyltransferase